MMASLAEQPFGLFSHHQQQDEYGRYPEPPQNAVFTSAPMAMSIAADAFNSAFGTRAGSQDMYAATPSTMGYEPSSLYADATPNYVLNGRASPGMYPDDCLPSSRLSTASSAPSAPSSAIGSPQSNHGQLGGLPEWSAHGFGVQPSIVGHDYVEYSAYHHGMEELAAFDFAHAAKTFVDPSLIHPEISRPPMAISPYDAHFHQAAHHQYPASPSAVSPSPQPHMMRTSSSSPFLHGGPFQPAYAPSPYAAAMDANARRLSMGNFISPVSAEYPSGDETKEKQRCSYPDCGKIFKDLKAHMLTHQNERPEKCPIQTCEYHVKGFARKYDKNRHTLTHYKGTMVCGFCPGSGSAAEKSFNRADVFKRHLTAVHGVEQTPPNARKKSAAAAANSGKKLTGYASDATGKCSTCSQTFSNAQDFYEHLDDCVLRIVQQEDPAEAINARRLAEVENDKSVHQTLEKNNLPTTITTQMEGDDEDFDMADDDEVDDGNNIISPASGKRKTNPPNGVQKSRGVTHSRGGVPLVTKPRGRKNRRDYPSSWGFDKGQMTMKKRIMAVFDGPRRLAKDDMMLSTDHEVRIKLSDGKSYVTDLDVQTLKRAEGFLNATDDEKGPWISDDPSEDQLKVMQEMLQTTPSNL